MDEKKTQSHSKPSSPAKTWLLKPIQRLFVELFAFVMYEHQDEKERWERLAAQRESSMWHTPGDMPYKYIDTEEGLIGFIGCMLIKGFVNLNVYGLFTLNLDNFEHYIQIFFNVNQRERKQYSQLLAQFVGKMKECLNGTDVKILLKALEISRKYPPHMVVRIMRMLCKPPRPHHVSLYTSVDRLLERSGYGFSVFDFTLNEATLPSRIQDKRWIDFLIFERMWKESKPVEDMTPEEYEDYHHEKVYKVEEAHRIVRVQMKEAMTAFAAWQRENPETLFW